jgi:adenylosuccinate synthase
MHIEKYVDAVVGLQYGDEGKGKVIGGILEQHNYSLTARYNGGPNAGHSIQKSDNTKYALHQLPSSVLFNQAGYIGPGCVLNLGKLLDEIYLVQSQLPELNIEKLLTIDPRVPIITQEHTSLDQEYHFESQGSTGSGIAPAYAEFYNRTSTLAKNYNILKFINAVDHVDTLLLEGAQGFYLDPYHGKYPFTTSSHCLPSHAASCFGFSPRKFRHIIGVTKCYETRSGKDPYYYHVMKKNHELVEDRTIPGFEKRKDQYNKLQAEGKEFGVTTGRKRKVRFLDLTRLTKAINNSGTNILIINKWDILEKVSERSFQLFHDAKIMDYPTIETIKSYIKDVLLENCIDLDRVIYSASPKNDIDWSFLND